METSEQIEAVPVSSDVVEATEAVESQQPSKKRSLEDMQQDTEPDASEPHQASPPEPEAKRPKTSQEDKNGTADVVEDESAEEGELEDEDDASENSDSGSEEMDGEEDDDTRPATTAAVEKPDAGAQRTTRSMAKTRAQVGWNQGITSQIRTSLGGSAKTAPAPFQAKSKEPTPEPEAEAESESQPTTEATPSQAPPPAPADKDTAKPKKKTRQELRREYQAAQAASGKEKGQDEKPFEHSGLLLHLPTKKSLLQPKGNNLGAGVWKAKFKSWCQSFISRNIDQQDRLNADIVVAALQAYINTRARWTKKKQQGVALAEAKKPQTKTDIAANLATILKNDDYLNMTTGTGTEDSPMIIDDGDDDDVQEVSPPSKITPAVAQIAGSVKAEHLEGAAHAPPADIQEDEPSDDEMKSSRPGPAIMSEEEDLAEQRRYFPGLPESERICVYCATPGHMSSACPKTACKFCDYEGHFSWNCPTRERCTKCRQLGHGKGQCTEKLIHLDEEGMECATCGSQTHEDDDCEALWRSYKPQRGAIKKVNVLPAYCGACGTEGHYSSDCSLHDNKPRSKTWALKTRDLYLDKNATQGPISNFASVPNAPQLQIKGASAARKHIFYADSDGSEEGEFLGQKVKPRAPPGNISMSSNIQLGNFRGGGPQLQSQPQQNGRGQQRGGGGGGGGWSAQQPPLPPGPPPSGPASAGSYSRMSRSYNNQNQSRPQAPSNGTGRGGLPPKPPAPQHGYHSVAPPPHNGPGPNAKKPRTRQPGGNAPTGPSHHQQNGGGGISSGGGRRRGKNKRGGRQG
ncbi:zinc knuckle domain-containing protein [Colletotrichum kahawae]|uniref:Zinc knuckle domain-containing protein n=1 Tax=Colletotrichum kahawae TaxID=34407 RepID=A0AAD9XZZ5_COLKA|nr:zinc knuckle domain-containing protein [Colletotrichum kahawae]